MHHGAPAVLSSSGAVQAPWCTMKMCTIVQRAPPVVWWPLTPGAQHDYWGITGPSPHPYTPQYTLHYLYYASTKLCSSSSSMPECGGVKFSTVVCLGVKWLKYIYHNRVQLNILYFTELYYPKLLYKTLHFTMLYHTFVNYTVNPYLTQTSALLHFTLSK